MEDISMIGSKWRKWDLHFHTPSSYDYHNKSITNEHLIDVLKNNKVAAIAITDHHIIDVTRIKTLQKLASNFITIFPGIECRSELGGSELMHFIGIFPEEANIEYIWKQLQVKCGLDEVDITKKGGYDKVFCDFKETSKLIHELGGFVSVHAGKKSNSIERLKNDIKDDIETNKCIDILEISNLSEQDPYFNIVFPNISRTIPIVICSDNHNINDYKTKEKLWISSEPSFLGLKQIIIEPTRVYNGDEPNLLERLRNNKTKFIKSLHIQKKEDSNISDNWFNNFHLNFNGSLVAIIGHKGGGKSAITDIIALCGNTTQSPENFSFLNSNKFRKNKPFNLSENFLAELTWEDGTEVKKFLNENTDKTQLERIKYIPQNFFEKICTNVELEEFEEELKNIIFSHTPQEKRFGKTSLDELINFKSSLEIDNLKQIQNQISKINEEIIFLEYKASEEYQKEILNKIAGKRNELESHEKIKPINPQTSTEETTVVSSEEINNLRKEINTLDETLEQLNKEKSTLLYRNEELKKAKKYFNNLEQELLKINESNNEYIRILNSSGIPLDKVFTYQISTDVIEEEILKIDSRLKVIDNKTEPFSENSLIIKRQTLQTDLSKLQDDLNKPEKEYQKYLNELKLWQNQLNTIIGDVDILDSMKYLESELDFITNKIPTELDIKKLERNNLIGKIFNSKSALLNLRKELFEPVIQYIKDFKELKSMYDVNIDVTLEMKSFTENFLDMVNQQRVGTFSGKEDGYKKLVEILEKYNFDSSQSFVDFSNELIECLKFNKQREFPQNVDINSQLRKGIKIIDIYNYVFQFDYLQPMYRLMLGNKTLQELSPGERGALLLIFYLILDNEDIPLIIDQPEENLDNESVYNILVHFIKIVKRKRQIILVTHNPNLAVVCDAEQIIHMDIDKGNGNLVSAKSGAIENEDINHSIVNILEGTLPAFNNRDAKYIR